MFREGEGDDAGGGGAGDTPYQEQGVGSESSQVEKAEEDCVEGSTTDLSERSESLSGVRERGSERRYVVASSPEKPYIHIFTCH